MKDLLIFRVLSGMVKRLNYERFLDISGAFWCVEQGRSMNDFLIFLVPFGVLGKVDL